MENITKQKHTARRIYDRLVDEQGFTGGESTIRNVVSELRNKLLRPFFKSVLDIGTTLFFPTNPFSYIIFLLYLVELVLLQLQLFHLQEMVVKQRVLPNVLRIHRL